MPEAHGWRRSISGISFRCVALSTRSQGGDFWSVGGGVIKIASAFRIEKEQFPCYTFLQIWHKRLINHWIPLPCNKHIRMRHHPHTNALGRESGIRLAQPWLMSTLILRN